MDELEKNKAFIREFARLENEEIKKTLAELPNEEIWMIEIFKLVQFFEKYDFNMGTEWRTCILLSRVAFKEIQLAFLSFLRKHVSQSFGNLRTAIEAVGFMNAVGTNAEKSKIWMKKELTKENYDFIKLKGERWLGNAGRLLKEKYKFASEMCHPNMFKTLDWTKSELDKENWKIIDKFSFFDEYKNIKEFRGRMNFLIVICFDILKIYCEIFEKALGESAFKDKVEAKYSEYKRYLLENGEEILSTDMNLQRFKEIKNKNRGGKI
jgi:hypothetical protein